MTNAERPIDGIIALFSAAQPVIFFAATDTAVYQLITQVDGGNIRGDQFVEVTDSQLRTLQRKREENIVRRTDCHFFSLQRTQLIISELRKLMGVKSEGISLRK